MLNTALPIKKNRADAKRAPKARSVDTMRFIFLYDCHKTLSAILIKPHGINVFDLKNQLKKQPLRTWLVLHGVVFPTLLDPCFLHRRSAMVDTSYRFKGTLKLDSVDYIFNLKRSI